MSVAIRVPDLGTTVDEVTLISWLVQEGDVVKRGDPIAEIQTDKATGELESAAEGVLLKQCVAAGGTAAKGDTLAYIGRAGETVPDGMRKAETKVRISAPASSAATPKRPRVSPVVRNLAGKLGVELGNVRGTGQGGMITRQDVLRASKAGAAAPAGEELPRSQAAVARAVLKSIREIPHLRVAAAIDMTAVDRLRAESGSAHERISYDAVFLKAMAGAIQAVPVVAAHLENGRVILPQGTHIALAIGHGNMLFLPVIRDVDQKDLSALQRETAECASQARAGTLRTEQMTGACTTLSNLGMYPIESFDTIIYPEHSAILSVGAVQKKPVVADDAVTIRPVALVNLAVDHRLINGRTAAEFLTRLKEIVESGSLD